MARTRQAVLSAFFAYTQFVLSMIGTFMLLPIILHAMGARNYGLWLATGELLAYLSLSDLGVFSILPWLLAVAYGKREVDEVRRLLANSVAVGLTVSTIIVLGSLLLWNSLHRVLGLTPLDAEALRIPLTILVCVSAVTYPLRVFEAILTAQLDAVFLGAIKDMQIVLNVTLTWLLLSRGWSFLALSLSLALPSLLVSACYVVRVLVIAPEFLRSWPIPSWRFIRRLLLDGSGAWLSNFGVRMIAASNGLVISLLGHPEWAPSYVAITKVPNLLQQLCRVANDSVLVGLAQLHGERKQQRVREVIHCILVVHLYLAGAAACLVLAVNLSFVHWWIGMPSSTEEILNVLVAVSLVVTAFTHSLVTPVGVIGHRLTLGVAAILNGLLYVALALCLGKVFGLVALPIALSLSCVATTIVCGTYLLGRVFQVTVRTTLWSWLTPWTLRALPAFILAALLGYFLSEAPFVQSIAVLVPVAFVYAMLMRSTMEQLALPNYVRKFLMTFRLIPLQISSTYDRPSLLPEP